MGAFENALSEQSKGVIIDMFGRSLDEIRVIKLRLRTIARSTDLCSHTESTTGDDCLLCDWRALQKEFTDIK